MTLQVRDKVYFKINNDTYSGRVDYCNSGYSLWLKYTNVGFSNLFSYNVINEFIHSKTKLYLLDFQQSILGYSRGYFFPECDNLDDLTTFVTAIQKLCNKKVKSILL